MYSILACVPVYGNNSLRVLACIIGVFLADQMFSKLVLPDQEEVGMTGIHLALVCI